MDDDPDVTEFGNAAPLFEARVPKIFLFVNGRAWGDDCVGIALSEDGHVLASHISSDTIWAKHDLGLSSDWKHEAYRKHYPDGYALEWVEEGAVVGKTHPGLEAAIEAGLKNALDGDLVLG